MRMHAEDARRNGWTGRDGLREGGQRGKGEGGRVGGAGREVRVAREIRREGGPPFVRPSSWDAWGASLRKNVIEIAVNDTGGVIYYVQ